MDNALDFVKAIEIDPLALDEEWLEQPRIFGMFAEASAHAKKAADIAEQHYKLVKAEKTLEVREDPEKFDLPVSGRTGQPTEAVADAAVRVQPELQAAKQVYLNAKFEADRLDGCVFAFHQRKAALENLVMLHGQSYFAGPQTPREWNPEMTKEFLSKQRSRVIRMRRAQRAGLKEEQEGGTD